MARKKPTFDAKLFIARDEIIRLAMVSKGQLSYITRSDRVKFPQPVKRLGNGMLYERAEVMGWLKANDARR